MITKTIALDSVTVSLRRLTWGDDTYYNIMLRKIVKALPEDYVNDEYWYAKSSAYAMILKMMAHTQKAEGLSVVMPNAYMTTDELIAACDAFMDSISKELAEAWFDAAEELEKPLNDPELAPPDKLSADQRKDPL